MENEWEQWSVYVLKELERLNDCYSSLDTKVNKISTDIATLKSEVRMKGGVWGALGAMVPICIILLIWLVKENIK